MFKNKLKKVAGAVAVAGALLVSGLPASAAPDLTPIRDKYPDAYQFQWNGNNTVTVFFRETAKVNLIMKHIHVLRLYKELATCISKP